MKRIKKRATLYAMGLVLLLITIFIITIIQDKKQVLEEKTSAHRSLLRNSFELSMLETQKGLSALACKISSNQEIVNAFDRGDRQKLFELALPYFQESKHRGETDLAGFIRHDGFHFLRMQDPKKYGDNITAKRPMLAYAIKTHQPISALDITIYKVAVVTIVPIFKDNRFIGVIQTSADINRVQKRMDISGIKSAIAFDTNRLKALLPDSGVFHYNGYTLVSSNDTLFKFLPKTFSFEQSNRYDIGQRTYIIASRPLNDFKNDPIAMMTCAFDVTNDVNEYEREIRNLLLVSLILLSIMGIVLHYGFRILIQRIDRDTQVTRALNQKLEHQLHTDYLTLLPNRNALLRDINTKRFYALMLLNIDNFKEINDFYGHAVGDEALLALTRSIQEAIQDMPMRLYKMPSDEYAIALIEPMTSSQLESSRLAIVHHLQSKYYNLHGASIYVTLTMGMDIALRNRGINTQNILTNADMALKAAKKRHLSYMLYDETMQIKQEYQHNILWSKKVKEAIEEKRFTLYYQPIFDSKSGEIIEYEALIRMIDANGSTVAPGYFLPAAKQSRLYPMISQFVIEEVFKMLETTPHSYSVNLSVDDIFDIPTKNFLMQKLRASSHADRIIFELLESEGIENYQEVSTFIAEVKRFGSRIAIDDFGTGYSNFAHILRLDVDLLKIDGSLIRNIDTDTNAQTILIAVAEFSKHLGLKTIAEFVHSEAVYEKCKELGVDYLQGYYLGEPKPLG